MHSFKTEGIIIKRRNANDADRIITAFTRRHGKIQIKAAGIRKIQSRRSSHVELLNFSTLTIYKGKSMPILTEAQTIESFSDIKEDLTKVGFAYHICELVDGLCADEQENTTIFTLLNDTLKKLCAETENIAPLIHEFEINLLTMLGFYPRNNSFETVNTTDYIESILERRLKSRKLINRMS